MSLDEDAASFVEYFVAENGDRLAVAYGDRATAEREGPLEPPEGVPHLALLDADDGSVLLEDAADRSTATCAASASVGRA